MTRSEEHEQQDLDAAEPYDLTVPPLTVWCGLEAYDPTEDKWARLDVPGPGRWWMPSEAHPHTLAVELWDRGELDDGQYRPVWAPKDKRRVFPEGRPFELPPLEFDDEDEEDPAPPQWTPPPPSPVAPAPPPARPQQRSVATPAPRRNGARAAPQPGVLTMPIPTPQSAASHDLLIVYGVVQQQLAIQAEQAQRNHELALEAERGRATAVIQAEQRRSDMFLQMMTTLNDAKQDARQAASRAPLELRIAELEQDLDAAANTQQVSLQQMQEQLVAAAQQPEANPNILQMLMGFFQTDAGKAIAQRLLPPADPAPQVVEPPGFHDPGMG